MSDSKSLETKVGISSSSSSTMKHHPSTVSHHSRTRSSCHCIAVHLSGVGLDLHLGTLGLLLGGDTTTDLATSGVGSGLGLLGLLLGLGGGLLLLGFFDGGLTGSGTGFGSLSAAFLDHIERGTDNSSLVLDGSACAFLGDFLLRPKDYHVS